MTLDEFCDIVDGCARCFDGKPKGEVVHGAGKDQNAILMVIVSSIDEGANSQWHGLIREKHIQLIDKLLGEVRLKREQMFVTSCFKCVGGDATKCKQFLMEEIELVNPKYIITFGPQAFYSVTGIESWVPGKEASLGRRKVVPMLNPESVMSNEKYERYFINSARSIKKTMDQPNLDWW